MGFFTSKKEKEEKERKKREEAERKKKEEEDAAAAKAKAEEDAKHPPPPPAATEGHHDVKPHDETPAAAPPATDATAAAAAPASHAATSRQPSPALHPAPAADAVPPLNGHVEHTSADAAAAHAARPVDTTSLASSTPRAEPSPLPNRPPGPPGAVKVMAYPPGVMVHQHQHHHMMMQHHHHAHMMQHGGYYGVPPGGMPGYPPGAYMMNPGAPRVVVPGTRPPAKVIVSVPPSSATTATADSAPPSAPASPSPPKEVPAAIPPSVPQLLPTAVAAVHQEVHHAAAPVAVAAAPVVAPAPAAAPKAAPAAKNDSDDDEGPDFVEEDDESAPAPAAPPAVVVAPKAATLVAQPQFAAPAPANPPTKVVMYKHPVPGSPKYAPQPQPVVLVPPHHPPPATAVVVANVEPAVAPLTSTTAAASTSIKPLDDEASASFASTSTTVAEHATPEAPSTSVVAVQPKPPLTPTKVDLPPPQGKNQSATFFDSPAQSPERGLSPAELGRRLWVQERFAKLVCPQQYFGRITKLHNVRWRSVINPRKGVPQTSTYCAYAVRDAAEAAHLYNQGFDGVVADGSHLFSAQVQLDPKHGRKTKEDGFRVTTYALCELPNERARFAETVADATEMLQRCEACFVTEVSAFVVSSLSVVTVHALVDVTWTLFSEEPSPQCSIHHIPLQLFDPVQRNLLCALCTANDTTRTSTIVLNDLFSGTSLKSIQSTLNEKLSTVNKKLHSLHGSHRQTTVAADRRRHAVELQFSLVQAALDAKKAELLEQLDEDERTAASTVTRQLLTHNEIRRHLVSSLTHLRSFANSSADSQPFAQMATVVSSLGLLSNALESTDPVVRSGPGINESLLKVNMEHVIRSITEVSFHPRLGLARREPVESPIRRGRSAAAEVTTATSPIRIRSPPRVMMSPKEKVVAHSSSPVKAGQIVQRVPQLTNINTTLNRALSPPRKPLHTADVTTIGPNGTCLFDTDLRHLISKTAMVEWKLRIDDPGSWIGIGVRVGDEEDVINESRHLWIAPPNVPRMIRVRVAYGPHGNAKLTIHDAVGRQLDDNRIPHWHPSKRAFPQVSFGSERGSVTMVEMPHAILYQSRTR